MQFKPTILTTIHLPIHTQSFELLLPPLIHPSFATLPVAHPSFYTHTNLNTNTVFHFCILLYIHTCIQLPPRFSPLSYPKYNQYLSFHSLNIYTSITLLHSSYTFFFIMKSAVYYYYLESRMSRCLPSYYGLNLYALVVYKIIRCVLTKY